MTSYIALRKKPAAAAAVDELYNLYADDEIVAEVSEDGKRVRPRNPLVNPRLYWWPDGMFSGLSVDIQEFIDKLAV